jgi:hypothetical protein
VRIKTELLSGEHIYSQMPENERRFLTCIGLSTLTHECGGSWEETWRFLSGGRFAWVDLGFDEEGKIFVRPFTYAKSGKLTMTPKQLSDLFGSFLAWLSSAQKTGFLEFEEEAKLEEEAEQ